MRKVRKRTAVANNEDDDDDDHDDGIDDHDDESGNANPVCCREMSRGICAFLRICT